MELETKDELKNVLDEILSRLSVVEQSNNQETEKEDPKTEEKEDPKTEVESVDEIEKLLNS